VSEVAGLADLAGKSDLAGKTALVTGTAHGIGAAIAATLAGLGANVYGVDKDTVDVTDSAAVASLVERTGPVDVLVNFVLSNPTSELRRGRAAGTGRAHRAEPPRPGRGHRQRREVLRQTPDLGGINNTIDALRYVRSKGLAVYCGGTRNETDVSARACTHVAMASGADQVLAKPGMGVDGNEMARVMARTRAWTTR
jgi:hypothetical protein